MTLHRTRPGATGHLRAAHHHVAAAHENVLMALHEVGLAAGTNGDASDRHVVAAIDLALQRAARHLDELEASLHDSYDDASQDEVGR